MQALSDDLLDGAGEIAVYMYNDEKKRPRVYRLIAAGELPVIRKGDKIFSRKSLIDAAFQVDAGEQS